MNTTNIFNLLRKYDYSIWVISSLIFLIGIINLYSATHSSSKAITEGLYRVQIFWYIISMLIGVAVSFIRPKFWFQFATSFYFLIVFFLCLTLVLGHTGMGATRWLGVGIFKFQPSELMKIALVVMLAKWYSKNNPENELGFKDLIIPGIITFIPALLVIIQPDLGTGILVILISFVIAFYRRLKWKTILLFAVVGALGATIAFEFALKPYQQKRIITFLDPTADAKGSGYNAIQSKIAIGSGQLLGKGFQKSSQASLNYLPENHTDFVFSVYNEEHGFLGSLVLISLFVLLLYRYIWLATNTSNFFSSVMIIGLMSIYFWHVFINMGMVMGLMPIVGVPLPLMSYGGTSLLTFGICNGIVTGVSNSRNMF